MSKLPTGVVSIRGREYETVALRVQKFRQAHPDWTIQTAILHRDDSCVVMFAEILDEAQRVRATGHAEEFRRASEINKTSAVENCETSAIGRALACLGLGGTEFASADEVARAVSGQKASVDEARRDVAPERVQVIRNVADNCIALHAKDDAWACYEQAAVITDPEEKLLLWDYLKPHSKVRALIKEMAEQERATEKRAKDAA